MRYKDSLNFKGALGRSVAFHAIILTAILVNITFKNPEKRKLTLPASAQAEPVIEAVAITEQELQAEVDRLKKIEDAKKAKEQRIIAEQQRLKQEQERIKREQEAEKKRLAELQKQQEEAKKKLAEEQRKAEEAKKLRLAEEAAEKKRQEDLAKQKAAEAQLQKKLAAEEMARKAAAEEEAARQALLAQQQAEQNRMILREVDRYKLMVQQAIMRHWLIQGSPPQDATTRLSVRLSSSGTVLNVELKSSSGNVALDRSAIAAVYKASPLPVPEDPEVFKSFRELTLILRPDSIVSEG